MKIRNRAGTKTAAKVMHTDPPAPAAGEAYLERIQKLEHSIVRHFYEFFSPWKGGFNFEFAPFELRETEQGFTLFAAMPGFKESEIEVRAEPWRLFLNAKHEESSEKKGEHVFEEHNEFTRWVDFPAEVNPEKVEAVLSKGVLEVRLEKAQTAKKVEVHSKAA
jgi:HSP20 family protein